jgi:cytoskeletal protein RodZ
MYNESLKELGAIFKAKRKDLNISLKEAENSTSIRTGYLEAIEEGCIDQFISGVYAQGFMRQYASFLGLDIEKLMKELPAAFAVQPEKHEFAYGIGTLEMRGSMGGGVKWLPNLIWATVGLVAIIGAWYVIKFLDIF